MRHISTLLGKLFKNGKSKKIKHTKRANLLAGKKTF